MTERKASDNLCTLYIPNVFAAERKWEEYEGRKH